MLGKLWGVLFKRSVVPPKPIHLELSKIADTKGECLRLLEQQAGLPLGDLSTTSDPPREMIAFPAMRKVMEEIITSKTSIAWKDSGVQGYVSGSISYMGDDGVPTPEVLLRMSAFAALALSKSNFWIGRLHVSKNCEGSFGEGICTGCGYKSIR